MRLRWPASSAAGRPNLVPLRLARSIPSSQLADQAALELGNTAHDRHHQSAYVRCGVAPAFPEGDKATALLFISPGSAGGCVEFHCVMESLERMLSSVSEA